MSAKKNRIRLSDCSYLLHSWLCLYSGCKPIEVDLQKFQAWAENHTGVPYSIQQIREAVAELEGHSLISLERELLRMRAIPMDVKKFDPGIY